MCICWCGLYAPQLVVLDTNFPVAYLHLQRSVSMSVASVSLYSTIPVSVSVSRRGCSQPNLLRSGRGNWGDNWQVFWLRLLLGPSRSFGTRHCPCSQGLWDLRETDIKALKRLSGKWRLDNREMGPHSTVLLKWRSSYQKWRAVFKTFL